MKATIIIKLMMLAMEAYNGWLKKQSDEKLIEYGRMEILNEQMKYLIDAEKTTRKIMESPVSEDDKDAADKVWGNDG